MASSDDEVEVEQQLVSDYYFEHEGEGKQKEIISFSALPIQWNENERTGGCKELIYLRGAADCGLQKIFKPVIAWKFDLINVIPEIFVLSKEKSWIKLQKPRKCYEEIYRTILITVHCLSYAKRNPEATAKSIWDFLSRFFWYVPYFKNFWVSFFFNFFFTGKSIWGSLFRFLGILLTCHNFFVFFLFALIPFLCFFF